MKDGREYSSLLEVSVAGLRIDLELRRALAEIEALRGRPLLCYAANVLRAGEPNTTIELADDLPFAEMVESVPTERRAVDILVVTPGGSAQQVSSFVQKLRPRFESVAFIVPHMCMSAGTILVMSGNEIVMDARGFLGPIDPQVRNREGQWLPAQALFTLVARIQEEGQKALAKGQNPDWSALQLLKLLDAKDLGNAIAATDYAVLLVRQYLEQYKFSSWNKHTSTGQPVKPEERMQRAEWIAKQLSDHSAWKTHSHGIFPDVLSDRLKLQITTPDEELTRAIRRFWALAYWLFERARLRKVFISANYCLFKVASPEKPK